jgi:hypothetical protein
MNGHNNWFKGDPLHYVRRRLVDNLRMTSNPSTMAVQHGRLLDQLKFGYFDLNGSALDLIVRFNPISGGGQRPVEMPLSAYWCPYKIGQEPPGFVDVAIRNPPHPFVFTGAMNGCALVVTPSPVAGHFRVYHLHNAGTTANWNVFANTTMIAALTHNDYGYANHERAVDKISTSFNFLYYRYGKWNIVSQPQFVVASDNSDTQTVRWNYAIKPFDIPVDL